MSDEMEYLAEDISTQSSERVAWFPLTIYSKMWKKRDDRMGIIKQCIHTYISELEDMENSQLIHIAKKKVKGLLKKY